MFLLFVWYLFDRFMSDSGGLLIISPRLSRPSRMRNEFWLALWLALLIGQVWNVWHVFSLCFVWESVYEYLSYLAKLSTTFTFLFVSIDQTTIKASTSTAKTYSPSRSSETGGHERLAKRKLSTQQHHHQPTSGFYFYSCFSFSFEKEPRFLGFCQIVFGVDIGPLILLTTLPFSVTFMCAVAVCSRLRS